MQTNSTHANERKFIHANIACHVIMQLSYQCGECGKFFFTERGIKRHVKNHSSKIAENQLELFE